MNTEQSAGKIFKLAWQIERFSTGRGQLFKRKQMITAQIVQLLFAAFVLGGNIYVSVAGAQQQGFLPNVFSYPFCTFQPKILRRHLTMQHKCTGTNMQRLFLTVSSRKNATNKHFLILGVYIWWSFLMWLFVLFAFIQTTMSVCNEAAYFNACLLHHQTHLHNFLILRNLYTKYCQLQLIVKHLSQMLSLWGFSVHFHVKKNVSPASSFSCSRLTFQ